ncbi:hypothetical protein B9Q02_07395 [Candidatus Marsarchaeota G1 archaeon BE_D]|uniref:Uncharacterized protein n=1 Tax=Candidatus Marsarchaeota G1 archaeon BE_D TaxID=1978156 RepID=A0A2R6AFR7_9ARCH|nr:MAG: hypothetical protein B9Q02_07395 [Candidatus Marsarchaeota G1 archaeon BE_D]
MLLVSQKVFEHKKPVFKVSSPFKARIVGFGIWFALSIAFLFEPKSFAIAFALFVISLFGITLTLLSKTVYEFYEDSFCVRGVHKKSVHAYSEILSIERFGKKRIFVNIQNGKSIIIPSNPSVEGLDLYTWLTKKVGKSG